MKLKPITISQRPSAPRRFFSRFLAVLMLGSAVHGDEPFWNQFRGEDSTGTLAGSRPPVQVGPDSLAWKTPIPAGLSSPVLWGSRVFLTGVENDRLVTIAYEAETGRELWRRQAPKVPLERVHEASSPAASTPCVDAERLYVYFGSYGLLCYDHEGRELWQKPIATPRTLYGMSTSPILHGNRLILVLDNDANLPDSRLSQSRVIALDRSSGELIWETARPLLRSGWSTPAVWKHARGEDLVVLGSGRVYAYNPETGAEKWFATGYSRETIAQPVFGNGHVYVSSSMLGGVADDQPDPEPFWKAMLHFDVDGDGRIARSEITKYFTFPFRPELPVEHPGFGLPLPSDPSRRRERQAGIFSGVDRDKDDFWTRDEFLANMSFQREKPRLAAIRPGGHGEITGTHVEWQLNRSIPEIPSPLFYGGLIYLVRNGGLISAVDSTDGTLLYTERLGSPGQYSASPIAAGEHIYLLSNRGGLSVIKASKEFELVHQQDLEEPCMVTPALDSQTIYIRTGLHLAAFRNAGD